jgi:hypothetical protein
MRQLLRRPLLQLVPLPAAVIHHALQKDTGGKNREVALTEDSLCVDMCV